MQKNLTQKIKGSDFLKMKESDKVNLVLLVIFLVCFVLGYFVVSPSVGAYRENKISIENSKLKEKNLEEKAALLNNLGEKLKAEKPFIDRTKDVLPTDPQVPELLLMLDHLAIRNSLYISTFSPVIEKESSVVAGSEEATKKNPWKTVNLQFDIVGKYLDIKSFIKDLEQNIRPLDITNINISGGGDNLQNEETVLRFHIGANAYYQ